MNKVLFVCTANICRSPMAQAIFDVLAEDEGLALRSESAGTAALEGRSITPYAIAALEEVGIYPSPHRARRVSSAMVGGAELVLAMTPQHAAILARLQAEPAGGIHTLPGYATGAADQGIPDPYGLTIASYRNTLRLLYEYLERAVDRLGN